MPPPTTPDLSSLSSSPLLLDSPRLSTLSLLSNYFIRHSQMEQGSHRNASIIDNELHINNSVLPFQIRNLNHIPEDYSSTELEELRSDGQSHERLLLSSARQNVTNRNTLIFSPRSGGIPLRRLNAVRFGRCPHAVAHEPPDIAVAARELQKYVVALLDFVAARCPWLGQSPLFVGHSSKHHRIEVPALEHLFACLDTTMDAYICQRNQGILWQSEGRKRPAELGGPLRKRRRVERTDDSRGDRGEGSAKGSGGVNSTDEQAQFGGQKRNKKTCLSTANPADGTVLALALLSYAQKLAIMNVVYTSYLQDGSNFALSGLTEASLAMAFSSVNYDKKRLMGVFTLSGNLAEILGYVMGTTASLNLPRDKTIVKRLWVAEKVAAAVEDSGQKASITPFLFPFAGSIVDFQHHDLRFLRHIKMQKNVPIRNLHLARTKTARARLQLQEWMKIHPFRQFRDSFLMKTLAKLRRNLCNFDNVSLAVQEDTLDLARGLQRHLATISGGLEPQLVAFNDTQKGEQSWHDVWHEHKLNHESQFVKEWDKKLSDKLAEFLMCEEHCLLNVQLNYVLFTAKVDTASFVDAYIHHHLCLLPRNKQDEFSKYLSQEQESQSPGASREAVMVCSLNRKTGELQVNNTRAMLNYRNVHVPETHFSVEHDEGSAFDMVDLDDWRHVGEERFRNPDDGDCSPTILKGHYKRSGGGSSVYGVV